MTEKFSAVLRPGKIAENQRLGIIVRCGFRAVNPSFGQMWG
jgi:hypothetical protein